MAEEEYTKSLFNMAISTLNRINFLLSEYNQLSNSELNEKYEILLKLYEEVYPFEEKKHDDKKIKEWEKLIEDISKDLVKFNTKYQNIKSYAPNSPVFADATLLKNINDLSKKVRKALHEHKLLMKMGEDPGKAIIDQ